jgi:hypothetical protein
MRPRPHDVAQRLNEAQPVYGQAQDLDPALAEGDQV